MSGRGQFSAGQHRCAKVLAIKPLLLPHFWEWCFWHQQFSLVNLQCFELLDFQKRSHLQSNCWACATHPICEEPLQVKTQFLPVERLNHCSQTRPRMYTVKISVSPLLVSVFWNCVRILDLTCRFYQVVTSVTKKSPKMGTNACTQTERIIAFTFLVIIFTSMWHKGVLFGMILFERPKQVSYIVNFNVNRQTPLINRSEEKRYWSASVKF